MLYLQSRVLSASPGCVAIRTAAEPPRACAAQQPRMPQPLRDPERGSLSSGRRLIEACARRRRRAPGRHSDRRAQSPFAPRGCAVTAPTSATAPGETEKGFPVIRTMATGGSCHDANKDNKEYQVGPGGRLPATGGEGGASGHAGRQLREGITIIVTSAITLQLPRPSDPHNSLARQLANNTFPCCVEPYFISTRPRPLHGMSTLHGPD